jgi:hypothetical protein
MSCVAKKFNGHTLYKILVPPLGRDHIHIHHQSMTTNHCDGVIACRTSCCPACVLRLGTATTDARCMPLVPGCRARTHRTAPLRALVASQMTRQSAHRSDALTRALFTTRGPGIDDTDRACSPLVSSLSKVPAAPSSLGTGSLT